VTVRELIVELSRYDAEREVLVCSDDYDSPGEYQEPEVHELFANRADWQARRAMPEVYITAKSVDT
jgi:hypothetical protein